MSLRGSIAGTLFVLSDPRTLAIRHGLTNFMPGQVADQVVGRVEGPGRPLRHDISFATLKKDVRPWPGTFTSRQCDQDPVVVHVRPSNAPKSIVVQC